MASPKERRFGEIPEWAKSGGLISLKNYDFRAGGHMALHSGKRERQHPTITRQSPEFLPWFDILSGSLGDLNWSYECALARQLEEK